MTIADLILELAALRGSDKTICPSEVARAHWPAGWRSHMEEVRQTAFLLRDEGKVRIEQKGKQVNGNEVTGPVRIRIVQ